MSDALQDLSTTTTNSCHIQDRDTRCLSFEQVDRLYDVVSNPVQIFPKEGNFPTLSISPTKLVRLVRSRLQDKSILVKDVRLNGSGASYCLAEEREKEPKPHYNDLDIIFRIEMKSEYDLHVIKDEVLSSLFHFFPEGTQTDRISPFMLEESYVKKRVKVCTNSDRWSLISLGDDTGTNIELKFVDSMKRQYEFSVDSFQILLDSLFSFEDAAKSADKCLEIKEDFYPNVQAISLYGSFSTAMSHLNNRLIATRNPEEIRGGGLLKYCYLLVNGYQPCDVNETESQEPYMCSRFFIDFPHTNLQFSKIHKYVVTRFLQPSVPERGLEFLETLLATVANKAKCIMESERYKTIGVIQHIQAWLLWQYSNALFKVPIQAFWHQPHPQNTHQSRSSKPPLFSNHHSNMISKSSSCVTQQPLINFPHSQNNAVPIGPTPTPVW